MLSARYAGQRSIRIEERQADPPAAGEVQIAVAYTGLCGTDLHILHGDTWTPGYLLRKSSVTR